MAAIRFDSVCRPKPVPPTLEQLEDRWLLSAFSLGLTLQIPPVLSDVGLPAVQVRLAASVSLGSTATDSSLPAVQIQLTASTSLGSTATDASASDASPASGNPVHTDLQLTLGGAVQNTVSLPPSSVSPPPPSTGQATAPDTQSLSGAVGTILPGNVSLITPPPVAVVPATGGNPTPVPSGGPSAAVPVPAPIAPTGTLAVIAAAPGPTLSIPASIAAPRLETTTHSVEALVEPVVEVAPVVRADSETALALVRVEVAALSARSGPAPVDEPRWADANAIVAVPFAADGGDDAVAAYVVVGPATYFVADVEATPAPATPANKEFVLASPHAAGQLLERLPFDPRALDLALQKFLTQLEGVGARLGGARPSVYAWVATGALMVAAGELARRRLRRRGRRASVAVFADASWNWLTEDDPASGGLRT